LNYSLRYINNFIYLSIYMPTFSAGNFDLQSRSDWPSLWCAIIVY